MYRNIFSLPARIYFSLAMYENIFSFPATKLCFVYTARTGCTFFRLLGERNILTSKSISPELENLNAGRKKQLIKSKTKETIVVFLSQDQKGKK